MTDEYLEYLSSPAWKRLREICLKRNEFKCRACKKTEDLHVHHLTYERIFKERVSDLIVLCSVCHTYVEKMIKLKKLSRKGDSSELRRKTIEMIRSCKCGDSTPSKTHQALKPFVAPADRAWTFQEVVRHIRDNNARKVKNSTQVHLISDRNFQMMILHMERGDFRKSASIKRLSQREQSIAISLYDQFEGFLRSGRTKRKQLQEDNPI